MGPDDRRKEGKVSVRTVTCRVKFHVRVREERWGGLVIYGENFVVSKAI